MDVKDDDFSLVTRKIRNRERQNGLFFVARDIFELHLPENLANEPSIQTVLAKRDLFSAEEFQRSETNEPALLFKLKRPQANVYLGNRCLEEHLTIDSKYDRRKSILACAHYKLVLRLEDGIQVTLRCYFNHKGEKLDLILKLSNDTVPLSADTSLFIELAAQLDQRMQFFKTLLTELVLAKPIILLHYTQTIVNHDVELSELLNMPRNTLDKTGTIIACLTALIHDTKLRNHYEDESEDTRTHQYETLLDMIQTQSVSAFIPTVSSVDSATVSSSSGSTSENIATHSHIPQVIKKHTNQLSDLIDEVLKLLLIKPGSALFMEHHTLLNKLELECWSLLYLGTKNSVRYVSSQKARLPFRTFAIEEYFSEQLFVGNLSEIQILIPHISSAYRTHCYWALLKSMDKDTAPFTHTLIMCSVSRYLVQYDPLFHEVFLLRQREIYYLGVEPNTYIRPLGLTLISGNLEAFKLYVEQGVNLKDAQVIIGDTQTNALDSCLLFYKRNKTEFLKILFAAGVQITDTTVRSAFDQLRSMDKTKLGDRIVPEGISAFSVPHLDSAQGNSLKFAMDVMSIRNDLNEEVLSLLLEHSDLETTTVALAKSVIFDVKFACRFFLSNHSWVAFVNTQAERDTFCQALVFTKGQPMGLSHIFYSVDAVPSAEFLLKNRINQVIGEHFGKIGDAYSDEDKRTLIHKLISEVKEIQKDRQNQMAQNTALSQLVAALFIWGNMENHNLNDCKIVLQILYLKIQIHSRVMTFNNRPKSEFDILHLSHATQAINFVENYHCDSIRAELEKDGMYLLIKRNSASTNPNALFVMKPTQSGQSSKTQTRTFSVG